MTPARLPRFWPIVVLVCAYAYGNRVKTVDPSTGTNTGLRQPIADLAVEGADRSEVEYVENGSLEPLYDFLIQLRLFKLCKLLREAQLEDVILEAGSPLTVFAPTDGSFVFLPGGTLEEIQRDPQLLREFVLRHIVVGDFRSQNIQDELAVPSLQGSGLRFNIYGPGQVYTVSGSQIIDFDLPFELGVLHIIDHPLYPIPETDIVGFLQQPTHEQFDRLLFSAGLTEYLSGGTFTIFVPDDKAFGFLSNDLLDALSRNRTLAERILLNHVLPGSIYTSGISNGGQLEALGGATFIFTESRGLTFVNGVPIVTPDVPVTNGVIHVINRVLLPDDIETDCQCRSSTPGTVPDTSRHFSQPAGQHPSTGGQFTSRQPQDLLPRVGVLQPQRPVGQTGHHRTTDSPYRGGKPHRQGSFTGQNVITPIGPGSLIPARRPGGQVFEAGYPESLSGTEQPSPDDTIETGRPASVPISGTTSGIPTKSKPNKPERVPLPPPPTRGPVPSRSRTTRYPGNQQRITPATPALTTFAAYRPTRGPLTRVTQSPRYPVPNTQRRQPPSSVPAGTTVYPGSQGPTRVAQVAANPSGRPQDSVGKIPQISQPEQPSEPHRKQPATQSPHFQPNRYPTPQSTRRVTPRPTPIPQTQKLPTGHVRTSPTSRPGSRPPASQTEECRRPGKRFTQSNRNLPLCSIQEPCQSLGQPYDPSDPRPQCPGASVDQGCRDPLRPPSRDDRRPACRVPQRTTSNCRQPGEPLDSRPLCPSSVRNCRLPEEPENPYNRLPVCQEVFSVEGCRRADEAYDPEDRRPECPPDDCRPPQEPLRPGDTRPLCSVNEEDSIRQSFTSTTPRPRYPQGSQPPLTPSGEQGKPGKIPTPRTPSWQRPQSQPHSSRQPPGVGHSPTRKPGKQPYNPPTAPGTSFQPLGDSNALGEDILESTEPPNVDRGSPFGQPQDTVPSPQGRPGSQRRPSPQSGLPPQRPSTHNGRPIAPGGESPQPHRPTGRPFPQGDIPPSTSQGQSTQSGIPGSTGLRPSSQGQRPYPGLRPNATPAPFRPPQPTSGSPTPGATDDSTRNLLDIARDPGLKIKGHPVKLTIVLDLFERAGLLNILEDKGPLTAFLPSDEAFKKLPRGVIEQLSENPELLQEVLLYHIVTSEVRPIALQTSVTFPTLQGMSLVVTMLKEGRLVLIGGAKAVAVTRASNGIFYVINEFLYPLPHDNIVSALSSRPDLTQVTELVRNSGLTNLLTGPKPFTFFAPTDRAFQDLPSSSLQKLAQNASAEQELLLGHIIEGAHFGREFLAGGIFPNARGGKLRFKVLSYGYTVNDANIKTPEIVTGTGVIHLVDQVLLEPEDLQFLNLDGSPDQGNLSGRPEESPQQHGPSSEPQRGQPQQHPSGQPQRGQPQQHPSGQPQRGQPQQHPSGQPQRGQPQHHPSGQPQRGQPQQHPSGQPQRGQPQQHPFGQPQRGEPQQHPSGQPQRGQPQQHPSGQPQRGQPQLQPSGQPQRGQPQLHPSGQPQRGQPQQHPSGHLQPQQRPSSHPQSGQQEQRPASHPQSGQPQQTPQRVQPQQNPLGGADIVKIDAVGSYDDNYPEITQLAKNLGLNLFLTWITNTGLIEKVSDGGTYTILAPTDEAVLSLPGNFVQAIDSDPDQVRPLLKYHIVAQEIDLNRIRNEQTVSTLLQDKRIRLNVLQDGPNKIITACGVPIGPAEGAGAVKIIVVSQALYPPSGNLAQIAEASPILQNLTAAVRSFHLGWMLNGQGPTTLIAPSDTAFEALSHEDRKNLVENRQAFTDLLKRHLIKGSIYTSGILDGMQVRSEKREPITFSINPVGGIAVNSIPISYSDITATNGVLHVIDHFL